MGIIEELEKLKDNLEKKQEELKKERERRKTIPDITNLSDNELKGLRADTLIEIDELERGLGAAKQYGQKVGDAVKPHKPLLADLLSSVTDVLAESEPAREELVAKKKLLEQIDLKLKVLQQQLPAISPAQAKIAEIKRLIQERDDLKANSPQALHAGIDGVYAKLIDDELKKP